MSTSESTAVDDLPSLIRLVASRFRVIAIGAALGLLAAVVMTLVMSRNYEATAFLEVEKLGEIPTVEEKLRFPSLYRRVTASDDGKAADALARRTRVRTRRGSKLIAVTVRHPDPQQAADEANALVEAFIDSQSEAVPGEGDAATLLARLRAVDSLPDPSAADSLETLAATWRTQSAEFEKLAARYDNDASHPAVIGARKRLDTLRQRIADRLADLGKRIEFPTSADNADPAARLAAALAEIGAIRETRPSLETRLRQLEAGPGAPFRLAERATAPTQPAGPRSKIIWLAGAILGGFVGLLLVLCGCCGGNCGRGRCR